MDTKQEASKKVARRKAMENGYDLDMRDEEIKNLHFVHSWTLREIGDKYSISRERVRQIIGGSNGARRKLAENISLPNSILLTVYQLADIAKRQLPKISIPTIRKIIAKKHHAVLGESQSIGEEGEIRTHSKLIEIGIENELMPFGHPFDILTSKNIRIDVKTSKKPAKTSKFAKGTYYRFRTAKDIKKDCDFFVFYAIDKDVFWVVPFDVAPRQDAYISRKDGARNWKHLKIDWDKYENNFDLLRGIK